MTSHPINIILFERTPLLLQSLSTILKENINYNIVSATCKREEIINTINKGDIQIDLCILDATVSDKKLISDIKKTNHSTKILILSAYDHEYFIIEMLRSGANGYLSKEADITKLDDAITSIQQSGFYYSSLQSDYFSKASEMPKLDDLELKFLTFCCKDMTYKQIGEKMNLSARTIESYRANLSHKLKLKSRIGIVDFCFKNGLLDTM